MRARSGVACLAALVALLAPAAATAQEAGTVLEAQQARVVPCPLPQPGEPPIGKSPEPVLCDDGTGTPERGGRRDEDRERERDRGGDRGDRDDNRRRDGEERDAGAGAEQAEDEQRPEVKETGDPFASLGGGSPFCKRARLSAAARRNCRQSGSIAHAYPPSRYLLDIHIKTGVTNITGNFFTGLQSLMSLGWLGLVYMLKAVLLALEWSFSLDLLGTGGVGQHGGGALGEVGRALQTLHREVLGRPAFLAAMAALGLWVLWRGLVQKQTIESVRGALTSVALMVVVLVVITNPAGTVGRMATYANEASLSLMAGASAGTVKQGPVAFSDSMRQVFDTVVLRPWCALQFNDVDWCLSKAPGDSLTRAERWLRFNPTSAERIAEYEILANKDFKPGTKSAPAFLGPDLFGVKDKLNDLLVKDDPALKRQLEGYRVTDADRERVEIQNEGSTFTRIALFLAIAVGLVGAICLLGWVALKLLEQAILAIVYTVIAAIMLLLAAFGRTGRESVVRWGQRLLGALIGKVIYALLLAVVLIAVSVFAGLDEELGWLGAWVLTSVFWWAVFLRRKQLLEWVSVPSAAVRGGDDGGDGVMGLYYKARAAAWLGGRVAGKAAGPVAAARGLHADGATGRAAGIQAAAREGLGRQAELAKGREIADARRLVANKPELQDRMRATDSLLSSYDRDLEDYRAGNRKEPPQQTDEIKNLLGQREMLDDALGSERLKQAERTVGAADANLARTGGASAVSEQDREAWIAQRRRDIEQGLPAGHERSLRAAGIDPAAYDRASGPKQAEMEGRSQEAIERDRELLASLPADERLAPPPGDLERARIRLPEPEVSEHIRVERQVQRGGQRLRTQRHNVYRRRR